MTELRATVDKAGEVVLLGWNKELQTVGFSLF